MKIVHMPETTLLELIEELETVAAYFDAMAKAGYMQAGETTADRHRRRHLGDWAKQLRAEVEGQ